MISYEKIVPLIPGNHIKDWQKIRKKQWKFVKKSLAKNMYFDSYDIKFVKDSYYLAEDMTGNNDPIDWEPRPILPMWLSPDQSQEQWDRIWDHCVESYNFRFDHFRKEFLADAHTGEYLPTKEQTYGAFGGMEQRLLEVFVRSETYTDDLFTLGKTEYRKIPWESPYDVHNAIICKITHYFRDYVDESLYSPYQWLHNLFISTFDYDIKYDERGDRSSLTRLSNLLSDEKNKKFHENHVKAGLMMVDIIEDQMAPKYLRDLWKKVKKDQGY